MATKKEPYNGDRWLARNNVTTIGAAATIIGFILTFIPTNADIQRLEKVDTAIRTEMREHRTEITDQIKDLRTLILSESRELRQQIERSTKTKLDDTT